MKEALKEYAEGNRSADYIARKYNVSVSALHKAYAALQSKAGHNGTRL